MPKCMNKVLQRKESHDEANLTIDFGGEISFHLKCLVKQGLYWREVEKPYGKLRK
jgi:hypothetical protein